jgi:hypothetical protein
MFSTIILALAFSKPVLADQNSNLQDVVRKNCRQEVMERAFSITNKSLILQDDLAQNLVEEPNQMILNLADMESMKLLKKSLSVVPWSDSYWPLYEGGLGHRYNDPEMHFGNWKDSHDYVVANTTNKLIQNKQFDFLSPSEKYDLILDLKNDNLTKHSWADGEAYFKEYGKVETWMGLCHGWAAAAMMMDNPERRVEVKTNLGQVTFYPSDIKGLGTMLWANGRFETRFIGGRCNTKNPKVDELGRPIEDDCLDNNPGTWHLAVVNQIGRFDRSFIIDASSDYQVWNQPVYSYEYLYFNPKTNKESDKLAESIVNRNDWDADVRKSVRAPEAKSIVGVIMHVIYVSENSPTLDEFQGANFGSAYYKYDLELDGQGKIIGGEWYSYSHPDFIWVAQKNVFPKTYGDDPSLKVDLSKISSRVKKAAGINAKYKLPFGPVVREMFKASALD